MIFTAGPHDLTALAEPYARPPEERWSPVPEALDRAIAADTALGSAAMRARQVLPVQIPARLVGLVPREVASRFGAALLAVPRERFVLPEDIGSSAVDAPAPLDAAGLATVSAPHAYVLTYGLLGLEEGDHLVEMGTGTGYGAALASHVVGPRGEVTSIEIDPDLHQRARRLLAADDARGDAPITLLYGDAHTMAADVIREAQGDPRPLRIAVTYALSEEPEEILALLPEGGRLVAPVGIDHEQALLGWTRVDGVLHSTAHGAVRYVAERR